MKKLFKKIYLIIKKNPFVASIVGSIIGNLITLLINFLIKTLPSKNMNPSASNDILTWILLGFNILYFSIIFIIQIKVIIRNKKNKVQAELSQISEQSTVFFHKRIQDAFPGLNGLQWIRNPKKAIKRLDIFFKNPIIFRPGGHYRCDPIWWFRGDENSPIDTFKKITSKKIMINFNELVISKIAVYRPNLYKYDFIYIETFPEKQTMVSNITEKNISDQIEYKVYANEEYALYKRHKITRQEYDDGSALINGKIVEVNNTQLRIRFLSKYNFFIAASESPYNSHFFDELSKPILDKMLKNEADLNELIKIINDNKRHLRYG